MIRMLGFDVETTDLGVEGGINPVTKQPGTGRIVSIAISASLNGKIVHEQYSMINPVEDGTEPVYTPKAMEVNGLDPEFLRRHGRRFPEVWKELRYWFQWAQVWEGHNIGFDIDFLQHTLLRNNLPWQDMSPRNVLIADTMALARKFKGRFKSHRLGDLCKELGVTLNNWHNAASDVEATHELLVKLVLMRPESAEMNFEEGLKALIEWQPE